MNADFADFLIIAFHSDFAPLRETNQTPAKAQSRKEIKDFNPRNPRSSAAKK